MVSDAEIAQQEGDYRRQSLYQFSDNDALHLYQTIIYLVAFTVVPIVSALLLLLLLRQRRFTEISPSMPNMTC